MVTHIVMFMFKEQDKQANIKRAQKMLLRLKELVAELKSIEIGTNFSDEPRAMDLCIITRFETKEDLFRYAKHPAHQEVVKFIKNVTEYSKVVDYETL